MNTFLTLTAANVKSYVRDRSALFWTLAFPIVFIVLFGAIFSGGGGKLPVALVDNDGTAASQGLASMAQLADVFDLKTGQTEDEAVASMKGGTVRAVLVLPKGFGDAVGQAQAGSAGAPLPVKLYTDPSQQQTSATITGVVSALIGVYNQQASGRPPILVVSPAVVQSEDIGAVAYLVPSILGMALMQLGLFSAIPIVEQRENLILKRLAATPLRRRHFIASNVVTRLIIGVVQMALILGLAGIAFGITVLGNPLVFAAFVLLGAMTFTALGYVVASFAATEDAAQQITSILQFPLMFLSGIFFSLDAMPGWLRSVAAVMPLTYLGDALRQVMVGGTPFASLGVDFAILGGWLLVCFAISARYFRWE